MTSTTPGLLYAIALFSDIAILSLDRDRRAASHASSLYLGVTWLNDQGGGL
ncbi:hypothetical protein GCM10009673_03080 [Nesterenkonia sandarakina]